MTSITVAIEAHAPPAPERSWKAPAMVVGVTRRNMGVRPRQSEQQLSLRMPHSTEVGQSGPPHRMETW